MPFCLLSCNLSGCCASSHLGILVVSSENISVTVTWPSAFDLFSPFLAPSFGNQRAQPLQEGCFFWCDGIADVIVNGVLEQTVWKGWVWWCSTLSAFGKVTGKRPIETNPALPSVWGSSACSPVLFGAALDDAQLPSSQGSFLEDVPAFHSTDSAPFPSGLHSLPAEERLPWARG